MARPKLDTFTRAYIEAALWSSTDNADDSGGEPLDKNYGPDDIDPATMKAMVKDCADFQKRYGSLIEDEPNSSHFEKHGRWEVAGHDFWLSRNGHGAGFFDGDWPENGDKLQAAAEKYGQVDLQVDDGVISDGIHWTPAGTSEARRRPMARAPHRVADFSTIPELISHAQQEGATHVKTDGDETKLYFPRPDGQYEEACVWTEGGYWHTHAPGNRVVLGCLPPGAEPIEGQVVTSNRRHTVRDYVAVDTRGRPVAGPFKDYGTAKGHADKVGGHVEFAMQEMAKTSRQKEQPYQVVFTTQHGTIEGWIWASSERQAKRRLEDEMGGDCTLRSIKIDRSGHAPHPGEHEHSRGSKYFVRKLPGMQEFNTVMAPRRKQAPSDEKIGAQYAQDQIGGEHFMIWVGDQIYEAEEMERREPGSTFPLKTRADYRKLARNMLQQLEWDTKRQMDASEIRALGVSDQKAFFSGFVEELKADTSVNWLADEIEAMHKSGRGEADEVRRVETLRRGKPYKPYIKPEHYTPQQLAGFDINDLIRDLNATKRDHPDWANDPEWAGYIDELERSIANKSAAFRSAYGIDPPVMSEARQSSSNVRATRRPPPRPASTRRRAPTRRR